MCAEVEEETAKYERKTQKGHRHGKNRRKRNFFKVGKFVLQTPSLA